MKRFLIGWIIFINFIFNVSALDNNGYMTESGIVIKPLLVTSYTYDDNLYNANENEISSSIFEIAPSVNLSLKDGLNLYELDFSVEAGSVNNNSGDDYLNGNILFTGHIEQSSSSRWDLSAISGRSAETRGTGFSEGDADSFDEPLVFEEKTAIVNYEYGNLSGFGRIALNVEYYQRGFVNFEEITNSQNYDSLLYGSTFFYNTNSRSNLFIAVEKTNLDYEIANDFILDSSESSLEVGFNWRSTAQTSGEFRLGALSKTFEDPERQDFNGLSWSFEINWQPLSYSQFVFTSALNINEPDRQEGDYVKEKLYSLSWRHFWNSKLSTSIVTSLTDEDYGGITRQDQIRSTRFQVSYLATSWLDLALYAEVQDRDSNNNTLSFDKSIIGIEFIMGI